MSSQDPSQSPEAAAFSREVLDGQTPAQIERNCTFLESLTEAERKYVYAHIFRYDGVQGVSAKEQFKVIPMYVLNFLDGECDIEEAIFKKAMKIAFQEAEVIAETRWGTLPAKKKRKKNAAAKKDVAAKKKRKMSPWVQHVRAYYQKRKEEDPSYLYKDAMRDARASYAKKKE